MAKEGSMKRVVLSIGIAILFVMFIGYAIQTVYPSPKYENFCEDRNYKVINDEANCIIADGVWNNNSIKPVDPNTSNGWCDLTFNCNNEYQEANEKYNQNLFFISLILGIIVFVFSVFLLVEAVSSGFMGGSVLLIIYGTIRNWGSLSDLWRTLMLGFALAVLVFIGYRKLK